MLKKEGNILSVLTSFACLFIFFEIILLAINYHINGIDRAIYISIKSQLPILKLSHISFWMPLVQFISAQIFIYTIYIYFLWYLVVSIRDYLALKWIYSYLLACLLSFFSIFTFLIANTYLVSHSFFSLLIRQDLFKNSIAQLQYKNIFLLCLITWLLIGIIIFLILINNLFKRQYYARHAIFIIFISLIFLITYKDFFYHNKKILPIAFNKKPNIFIVSFDALRPDYLSYFKAQRGATPQFDDFLKSSIVFTENYTPVARTFPSWVSILSAKHPLHTRAREDNIDISTLNLETLLPKILKQVGYETIYASDDNRFNNINNNTFGFEHVIGPSGNFIDFIVSALNDFPISNLVIPTSLGEWLFPANFANHASPHTYHPDNFIELLSDELHQYSDKPIFLAVHFNITAWPFYYFNDQQISGSDLEHYKNMLSAADEQFGKLLHLLKTRGFLTQAIFILTSDHGITLQLPGDRVTAESYYQGNINTIQLKRTKYNKVRLIFSSEEKKYSEDEEKITLIKKDLSHSDPEQLLSELKTKLFSNDYNYGIDTSWGYGNDVLSLKQNHSLLAFKLYGMNLSSPHTVIGRSSLLDITPTLLDFLNISSLKDSEGISLKPYCLNPNLQLSSQRPFYLETSFTFPEIEHEDLLIKSVLAESVSLFRINPEDGLISMTAKAADTAISRKQRAILKGDWLLAFYPATKRYRMVQDKNHQSHFESYISPPYQVLVNLKTKKWTTNLDKPFDFAPISGLMAQISHFYGREMDNYMGF